MRASDVIRCGGISTAPPAAETPGILTKSWPSPPSGFPRAAEEASRFFGVRRRSGDCSRLVVDGRLRGHDGKWDRDGGALAQSQRRWMSASVRMAVFLALRPAPRSGVARCNRNLAPCGRLRKAESQGAIRTSRLAPRSRVARRHSITKLLGEQAFLEAVVAVEHHI